MTLKERFYTAETKAGKWLMKLSAIAGIAIASCTQYAEYANYIPDGFIPTWLKGLIGIVALGGVIAGKLTVEKKVNPS